MVRPVPSAVEFRGDLSLDEDLSEYTDVVTRQGASDSQTPGVKKGPTTNTQKESRDGVRWDRMLWHRQK